MLDLRAGSVDKPFLKWTANGYRMPTECEWQRAASYQGGTNWTGPEYASGATADVSDSAACDVVSWHCGNSGNITHAVEGKNANKLGAYDMSGNVAEMCHDYVDSWPWDAQTDYQGPAPASGSYRATRGGSFSTARLIGSIAVGARYYQYDYQSTIDTGFRVACR